MKKLEKLKKAVDLLQRVVPKYGPGATPLSKDHTYFLTHPAESFWSLIPYYIAQEGPYSCSVASLTMVVNACRAKFPLDSHEPLATQPDLLEKAQIQEWKDHVSGKSSDHGIGLDLMEHILPAALKAYGVTSFSGEVVHLTNPGSAEQLHSALLEYEKDTNSFLIANFLQCSLTGDPEACGGHYSPIGAYDSEKSRVLILDVDRKWLEPYWVSEEKLLQAMHTTDQGANKFRGFVRVRAR